MGEYVTLSKMNALKWQTLMPGTCIIFEACNKVTIFSSRKNSHVFVELDNQFKYIIFFRSSPIHISHNSISSPFKVSYNLLLFYIYEIKKRKNIE